MIQKDVVVSLKYILKNDAGEVLDEATGLDPFFYLHGANNIVPGLEDALEGLKIGDKKNVSVSAEQGYGEHNPNLKIQVERSAFPEGTVISRGMQFAADVGMGYPIPFTVQAVEGDNIFLDGNHPLAGQTLHFEVEVLSTRAASKEELEHGHVHGPGGHHH